MAQIPNYSQYSFIELYQALNTLAMDRFPATFDALKKELESRSPSSKAELEQGYFLLDKQKWPDYAERLLKQIEDRGGFTSLAQEVIDDSNKYRTFWRRLGASIVDTAVLSVPAIALIEGFKTAIDDPQIARFYANDALNYVVLLYSIAMHARYGKTLGKMLTGVKVIDISETRSIGLRQALMRDLVLLVLTIAGTAYFMVFGIGHVDGELTGSRAIIANLIALTAVIWILTELVTLLFNKKRRAVHDFIAGTVVVRVP